MNDVSTVRDKVENLLGQKREHTSSVNLNPFLKKDGSLVNPYINYQKVLDDPGVTNKVKSFISNATGLTPTVSKAVSGTNATNARTIASTSQNSIVSAAQNYIGTPYVWGGESMAEGGMDCSGFVYNALKDAGYDIGRTTAQGYRSYGSTVSRADMQPGDLVFYGKDNNASHIGIYIGNGQMVHSSGGSKNTKDNPGKGVSVANVDYRSDFIEARRY